MISYLSLGSNQGDRKDNLTKALEHMNSISASKINKVSSCYETEPWGGVTQDSFLNLVIEVETELDPVELLHECQKIELKLGRKRDIHWGPRTIDIDILLYGDIRFQSEELIIPHPYLEQREFVLAPLREINPALLLPSGKFACDQIGEGKVYKLESI